MRCTLSERYGQSTAAQTLTFLNVLVADARIKSFLKCHRELSSFLNHPVGRDLNRDNMSCLHEFAAGEVIATHGAIKMLGPSC